MNKLSSHEAAEPVIFCTGGRGRDVIYVVRAGIRAYGGHGLCYGHCEWVRAANLPLRKRL